jgi:hypothetical protein
MLTHVLLHVQICVALSCQRCDTAVYHQACLEKYLKVCIPDWCPCSSSRLGSNSKQAVILYCVRFRDQQRQTPCRWCMPYAQYDHAATVMRQCEAFTDLLACPVVLWCLQKMGLPTSRKIGFPCPYGKGKVKEASAECKGRVSSVSVAHNEPC